MASRETIEAAEAAEILGLSTWTVYALARRGEIPHVRVGRRLLFRRATLLAWLEAREAESVRRQGETGANLMPISGTSVR